ncbi:hypothetical protein EMIT0P218_60009 [Pseudomonas sp. IT-P218]
MTGRSHTFAAFFPYACKSLFAFIAAVAGGARGCLYQGPERLLHVAVPGASHPGAVAWRCLLRSLSTPA